MVSKFREALDNARVPLFIGWSQGRPVWAVYMCISTFINQLRYV